MKIKENITAVLPSEFNYYGVKDLTRLGDPHDGGYLVRICDVKSSNHLLSFGIETDWSFEKDFIKIKNTCIDAYDGTTCFNLFFYNFIYFTYKKKPIKALSKLIGYFEFKRFFSGSKKFHKNFIGNFKNKNYIDLNKILKDIEKSNIFLKMDIEGSEYRCLDILLKFQEKFSSIVIEFHDVDCNLKKIHKFINQMNLNIVHIHINNYTPLTNNNIPQTIEVTFSKNKIDNDSFAKLPHKLDSPNNPSKSDYKLIFEDILF